MHDEPDPRNLHRQAFSRRTALRNAGLVALLFGSGVVVGSTQFSAFAAAPPKGKQHRVVILIDSDDDRVMRHAIGYAANLSRFAADSKETVEIEIVTNGSGIKLFRADTSPLQEPLAALRQSLPQLTYTVCNSALQIAEQKEGHEIALIAGARKVPLGIGRVMELEEAGWSYIHG